MLQQLNLPRQRRLRHVQQSGCTSEVQFGGDRNEAAELRELKHDSEIVLHLPVIGLDAPGRDT